MCYNILTTKAWDLVPSLHEKSGVLSRESTTRADG